MWDTIISFFNLIGSALQSMVELFFKIPKLFKMITYSVNELGVLWNMMPDWFFILGTITIVAAVLWIIIEII